MFKTLVSWFMHLICVFPVLCFSAVTDEDTVKRYYAKFEERFFQTCEKELLKINTFYSGIYCIHSTKGQTTRCKYKWLHSCLFSTSIWLLWFFFLQKDSQNSSYIHTYSVWDGKTQFISLTMIWGYRDLTQSS